MAATPLFVITDAGLAAASVATPTGPYIHITGFQVGDAYGYDPTREDTGLNGTLLYQGVPTSYSYVGDNTIDILCQIPPDAGPFDFGEVALELDGAVMFAKAVFDTPQTKYSALGTNIVSTYSFHCLLKLQQSVAVFQIDTASGIPPAVWIVDQWSDVYPAGVAANPDIPLIMVREKSELADSTLLQNTDDSHWTVGTTYHQYAGSAANGGSTFPIANASTSWVEVAANRCHAADLGNTNRRFVVETADGYFRSVSSVVVSGANYRFNLNTSNDGTYNNTPLPSIPGVGTAIKIFRDDQTGGSIYYSQIVDPPPPPALGSVGTPGLVYGGTGLYMPSPGVIQTYGLLQSPSANTGRLLTGGDNLNAVNWASGLYTVFSGVGRPANLPVAIDGHVWMHAENPLAATQGGNATNLTQIFYPSGGGGGDANGVGGYPPYWREWNVTVSNGQGGWSNWFPFSMNGKAGATGGMTKAFAQFNQGGTITWNASSSAGGLPNTSQGRGFFHCWFIDDQSRTSNLYLNGQNVSSNHKDGGAGYGRRHHDITMFAQNDTIQLVVSGNPLLSISMFFF